MKYIRTDKGVYEFTDEMCINKFGHIAYKDRPFICVYGVGNKVIKQADTIEELCDEFVEEYPIYRGNEIVGKGHQYWTYSKLANSFYNDIDDYKDYDYFIDEEFNFYGAIWTNKGLIYVAKMNDKGELELYEK